MARAERRAPADRPRAKARGAGSGWSASGSGGGGGAAPLSVEAPRGAARVGDPPARKVEMRLQQLQLFETQRVARGGVEMTQPRDAQRGARPLRGVRREGRGRGE